MKLTFSRISRLEVRPAFTLVIVMLMIGAPRDLDNILEIDRNPRDDEIGFLGDVVLVDLEGNSDN